MTDQIVRLGPEYFPLLTSGRPISNGSIFIGLPDTDPEIVVNQITVNALQEDGTTIPISQPISTSAGGIPIYNGSPVTLLVTESYSLKVLSSAGVQIYYVPSIDVPIVTPDTTTPVETVADILELINTVSPVDDQISIVLSFFDGLVLGGGIFHWDSSADKATADGGTIIDPDNIGGFDGTPSTLSAYFSDQGTGVGLGCWVRDTKEETFTTEFGAVVDGVTDDSAAWSAAIAATSVGGLLIHPSTGNYSSIDTSSGLTGAVDVNKSIIIQIDGSVKSTFSAIQVNPPFPFSVTADDVTFTGSGWIEGDGTINSINSGDDTTFPGLIHVTGDRFSSSVELRIPPKVGIHLYNCNYANISNGKYSGGDDDTHNPLNTAHFYIRVYQGTNHNISNNWFGPDGNGTGGGRATSAVFTNGTLAMKFTGNTGITLHEKILYHNGDNSLVESNHCTDMHQTDCIRIVGSNNSVIGNYGVRTYGGITVFDGDNNSIIGNTFHDVEQSGIVVRQNSVAYVDGFDNNIISENKIFADPTSIALQDGIVVYIDGKSSAGIVVNDNVVLGFIGISTTGGIRVEAVTPYTVSADVTGNRVEDAYSGYRLTRVSKCKFSGNMHKDSNASGYGLLVSGSTNIQITENDFENPGANGIGFTAASSNCGIFNNKIRNASAIGIAGVSGSGHSYGGNTYNATPLAAVETVSAVVTHTVTHGGIAPEAFIQLQTYNDAAGVAIVAKGYPTPAVTSPNFTIKSPNGVAWGGTENFLYSIIQ